MGTMLFAILPLAPAGAIATWPDCRDWNYACGGEVTLIMAMLRPARACLQC